MSEARGVVSIRRTSRTCAALTLACALLATLASGCAPTGPYEESRPALGTTVAITLWGSDRTAQEAVAHDAFSAIEQVEAALDSYDPASDVSAVNADPYVTHRLPDDARQILRALDEAGVAEWFDPTLWGVIGLYDFGGEGATPAADVLDLSVAAAYGVDYGDDFTDVVFARLKTTDPFGEPGLDFGGAAKGLALDRAAAVLLAEPTVEGALVGAGSSTLAFGEKPDGSAWRVGIEDPREPGRVVAVVESSDAIAVSTSGDYQQYFERDGVRYHHILDPRTGRPTRGVRSVTVIGISGLRTDILSTALFVAGPDAAIRYARQHDVGLYIVDDEGRAHVVPGPDDASFTVEVLEDPLP